MIGIYLSPRYEVSPGRTRNVLAQIVTYPEMFDEIVNTVSGFGLCYVTASQATHDAIAADGRAARLARLFSDDADQVSGIDELAASSLDTAGLTAAKAALENSRISAAWITGTHSVRDVLRWAVKTIFVTQILQGNGWQDVCDWINRNLDTKVSDVPLATRNRIRSWIASKGLDDSWITGSNTVRDVVSYIVNNLGWSTIRAFGKLI